MPGKGDQGEYGEVTSCSNCTDFQARRLGIRYKDQESGKNLIAHTLNGTGIAISRALVISWKIINKKMVALLFLKP